VNVKVDVEKQEPWRRILTIEVPVDDVEREYEELARRVAKRVRLPGFRKGKVPTDVVRRSFRGELDQEFLETVVPKAFGRALDETGIDPITEPAFSDVSFGESRPLSFRADFDARPELELRDVKGQKAEKEVAAVTDEQVESVLEEFRKSRPELEDVARGAIDGDIVLVDYTAVDNADKPIANRQVKDAVVELGAGRVVEPFEQALRGAEKGAVRAAEVPYGDDHEDPLLRGTSARYRIRVKNVQEKRFLPLDDAFVAKHADVSTVDELRAKVRKELEEGAERTATERVQGQLLEKVVDANAFDPPQALVEALLEDLVAQQKQEASWRGEDPEAVDGPALKDANRAAAVRQVRRMLVLDAIAKAEGIHAAEEEVRERVTRMARMRSVPVRRLVEQLGGDRFLRRLSREIRDKKVLAFLSENAEISVRSVPAGTP
jgi:trigger factor